MDGRWNKHLRMGTDDSRDNDNVLRMAGVIYQRRYSNVVQSTHRSSEQRKRYLGTNYMHSSCRLLSVRLGKLRHKRFLQGQWILRDFTMISLLIVLALYGANSFDWLTVAEAVGSFVVVVAVLFYVFRHLRVKTLLTRESNK